MRLVKDYLRKKLLACKPCYKRYSRFKYRLSNLRGLSFYFYDLRNAWRYMYWGEDDEMSLRQLKAKLLFYYHKIEKGLCMPGKKRLFALDVVPQVVSLIEAWERAGGAKEDPIYIGSIDSLVSYSENISSNGLDVNGDIVGVVEEFLSKRRDVSSGMTTPITISRLQIESSISYEQFKVLCELRRSFRDFSEQNIPKDVLVRAVELAQLSPSACNRQPCKVYAIQNKSLQKELLECQNGNAGFGGRAPLLLVLTADSSHFYGAIERNQPYVDGGLFAMSLQYSLLAQGLVSCCLNWCVTPGVDKKVHNVLSISDSERITMFMVVGFPLAETKVPKSHRKPIEDVLLFK